MAEEVNLAFGMASFSERHGYIPPPELQTNSLSETTRGQLWNVLYQNIWKNWRQPQVISGFDDWSKQIHALCEAIWARYFKKPLDMLPDLNPHRKDSAYDYIRDHFFGCEWHGAYSLLEFIVQNWPYDAGLHGSKLLNKVLIEERCGYTFIKKEIVPVSDEVEIKAIESALNAKVPSVREHMAKALALLSNFKKPDPENSIKESICAVEALAHKITGDKNGTLGQMVKKINGLHPSFVGALSQLYGFRNDGAGISHGSTKESLTDITLADAKFFLILCSGLVNYITAKESEGKVMKK